MPPFPKPRFTYNFQVDAQVNALRAYRETEPGRQIPAKRAGPAPADDLDRSF